MRLFHAGNKEIVLIRPQQSVYRDLLRRRLIRNSHDDDYDDHDISEMCQNADTATGIVHHKIGCDVFDSVDNAVRWCEMEWETEEVGRTYVDDLDAADHDYLPILTI
jgi:hypothetical protein